MFRDGEAFGNEVEVEWQVLVELCSAVVWLWRMSDVVIAAAQCYTEIEE